MIAMVEQGRYVDAIQRFYKKDATMQENLQPLRQGIATLTPKAGVQFLHLGENGFTETGASGFDLSATGHSTMLISARTMVTMYPMAGGKCKRVVA